MRIYKMITQEKMPSSLIYYQILSTHSLRKCIGISLENLYVDTGAYLGLSGPLPVPRGWLLYGRSTEMPIMKKFLL